jgi:hypothetical protein
VPTQHALQHTLRKTESENTLQITGVDCILFARGRIVIERREFSATTVRLTAYAGQQYSWGQSKEAFKFPIRFLEMCGSAQTRVIPALHALAYSPTVQDA